MAWRSQKDMLEVMVDRVENGWEDLDLEIPGGNGEEELGQALHTWIYWKKQYIRIAERDASPSLRSPAAQGYPSVDPPSPATAWDPSVSPLPSPATQGYPSVEPLSPTAAQDPALVHRRHGPLPGTPVLVRLRHLLPPQRRSNLLGCRHRHLQGLRRPNNARRKRSPRQRSQVTK